MLETTQFAQLVMAASVGYVLYITFFRPKAGEKQRMQQVYAAKQIVKQRSERWAV